MARKKNDNVILWSAILAAFTALGLILYMQTPADPTEHFTVRQLAAGHSLEVRVIGPDKLYNLQTAKIYSPGGCGYVIDWGDGTASPAAPVEASEQTDYTNAWPPHTECFDGLKHVYSSAGKYRINARITTIDDPEGTHPIWQANTWISIR